MVLKIAENKVWSIRKCDRKGFPSQIVVEQLHQTSGAIPRYPNEEGTPVLALSDNWEESQEYARGERDKLEKEINRKVELVLKQE
jgi:hypothetical protein